MRRLLSALCVIVLSAGSALAQSGNTYVNPSAGQPNLAHIGILNPPAPVLSGVSTGGSTTYQYAVVAYGHDVNGNVVPTLMGATAQTSTGQAPLSPSISITLTTQTDQGAAQYDFLKLFNGTWQSICLGVGSLGFSGAGSICVDQGQTPLAYALPLTNATADLVAANAAIGNGGGGNGLPGVTVTNRPSGSGLGLTTTSAATAQWQIPGGNGGTIPPLPVPGGYLLSENTTVPVWVPCSGDVLCSSVTPGLATVAGLQGQAVGSNVPGNGSVLLFNGSQNKWLPTIPSGDMTLSSTGAATVSGTGGIPFGPLATQSSPCQTAQGCTGSSTPGETAGNGLSVSGGFPNQQFALQAPVTVANGGRSCGPPVLYANRDLSPIEQENCEFLDAATCSPGSAVTGGLGSARCVVTFLNGNWWPAGGAIASNTSNLATTFGLIYNHRPGARLTSPVTRTFGGLNSSSPGVGLLRDGTTPTASELSADVTTSGSNAATVVATHLSSALPAAQGGTGLVSPTAHSIPMTEGASAVNLITAAVAGDILLDQGSGVDFAEKVMSGDCTIAATGAISCTKTAGVAFGPFATQATPCTVGQGCTGTASTLTGLLRGGSPYTGAELSQDVTTSGSNAATVVQVEGAAIPVSASVVGTNSSKQLIASPNVSLTEATAPAGVAASDVLNPDSTAHRWAMKNNNGTAAQVVASGADINTSDQVTLTHLTLPETVSQGGTQCSVPGAGLTIATLPGSPVRGESCEVHDANACTAGTTPTGSASTDCVVTWCGASWLPGGCVTSAASGGVTAVNVTAPILGTGGTTPTISLAGYVIAATAEGNMSSFGGL